jgi:predicted MFS family arabinose efflux permease
VNTPAAQVKSRSTESFSARRGWLGVFSVALGSFGLVLSEFLPIGLLPAISRDLHVSIGTAGFMVVATGLAGAVGAPVITVATSRLDRRVVLLALTVLLVLADALAALAPSFGILLVARLLLGAAVGGFWTIGGGIAGRLVRPAAVIRATSFITAGISLATVVSLPLGAFVSSFASWRFAFVVGAILGVIALVGQFVMLPRIPSGVQIRVSTLIAILRVPKARTGLIVSVFVFGAQFAAYTFVTPFLLTLVHLSLDEITIALLVFGVAGIIGNFVAGLALGRSVIGTLGASKIVLALAVILLPILSGSPVGVFILLAVWGFVWGGLPLGMQTWMTNATPELSEGGLALFVTTIQLSIAGGSVIGALVVSGYGIAPDFWISGTIAAIGAVVLLALGLRGRVIRPVDSATVPASIS